MTIAKRYNAVIKPTASLGKAIEIQGVGSNSGSGLTSASSTQQNVRPPIMLTLSASHLHETNDNEVDNSPSVRRPAVSELTAGPEQ